MKNYKYYTLAAFVFLSASILVWKNSSPKFDLNKVKLYKVVSFSQAGENMEMFHETDEFKLTCSSDYSFYKQPHTVSSLKPLKQFNGMYLLNEKAKGILHFKDSRSIASEDISVPAVILKNDKGQYYCMLGAHL
ncbi:MAG: hypothetical protein WC635_01880 [Bacteriovorax sp.]|jgi:hypothetical protein